MDKEQTTLRISCELKAKLDEICAANEETLTDLLRRICKRIVKRYEFDNRGRLIVK